MAKREESEFAFKGDGITVILGWLDEESEYAAIESWDSQFAVRGTGR